MHRSTTFVILGLASGFAWAQDFSDVPLAINLPTTRSLYGTNIGVRFTHRFSLPVRGNGKELFGLDGGNRASLGLDLSVPWIRGLNAQVLRSSDNKTLMLALQQQLPTVGWFQAAIRVERFDEVVQRRDLPLGTQGMTGAVLQVPMEAALGDRVTLSVVPTWLSRTALKNDPLVTTGLGGRVRVGENHYALVEYYPRPSRVPKDYHPGFALGYRMDTLGHRFTLTASNTTATVPVHVLGGDHLGGPVNPGNWSLGFNIIRVF